MLTRSIVPAGGARATTGTGSAGSQRRRRPWQLCPGHLHEGLSVSRPAAAAVAATTSSFCRCAPTLVSRSEIELCKQKGKVKNQKLNKVLNSPHLEAVLLE